jgi:hypothetical protein
MGIHQVLYLSPAAIPRPSFDFTASSFYVGGNNVEVFCDIFFDSDGAVRRRNGTSLAFATNDVAGGWYNPPATNIGNSFWIRFTLTSGVETAFVGSARGVWLQLNTTRSLGAFINSGPVGQNYIENCVYSAEVSSNSAGTSIISTHTATITLTLEV